MSTDVSVPSYEGLDSSSESWLAECFNDSEMSLSLDDMYASLDFRFFILITVQRFDRLVMSSEKQEFGWSI